MNQRPCLFYAIAAVAVLGACNKAPESKSRFLSGFSAADVIKKSYDQDKSKGDLSVSAEETSSIMSSRRIYHRDESADLRISESDQPSFLERIKTNIEQQVRSSGCTIVGGGSGDNNFSIAYTDGNVTGWIDIRGMPGTPDKYKLIITITES
jgi:hypothetical protein